MAITFVASGNPSPADGALPGGWQPGDVAFVVLYDASGSPSTPSGWTRLGTAEAGYRVLQSGDTTIGDWTGADRAAVAIYRGLNQSIPWDWFSWQEGTATTTGSRSASTENYTTTVHAQITSLYSVTVSGYSGGANVRVATGATYGVQDGGSITTGFTTNFASSGSYSVLDIGLREESTFPIVSDLDTTSGTVTSNSSSWTLTYPTNIASGDLLIALVSKDGGSGVPSVGGGSYWNGDFTGANGLFFALRRCDGTETGTFTLDIEASEQGSWLIYRIPAGTWYDYLGTGSGGIWPSASYYDWYFSVVTGASTTPDPPSLNPVNWDAENTLWIAVMGADTSRTVSAYPSSPDTFTNTGSLVSGGSNGATLAWGRLEKNASSVDPGTFTISNSDDWVAATIAIRPAAQLPKSLPPSRPLRHPLIYR